jgi:rhomboid family GlyGly-CTERM serine protease
MSRMGATVVRRLPVFALLLSACAVIASGSAAHHFEFDRAAIEVGQVWRLVTGHWTHWSPDHLFWDVATFGALGLLAERRSRASFLACTLSSAVAISAALWFLRPDVLTYRGLSGIDVGLFTLVATGMFRDARAARHRPTAAVAVVALSAFALKLTWELAAGSALFVDAASAGFQSLPLAHAIGGAVGALGGWFSPGCDASGAFVPSPVYSGERVRVRGSSGKN